MRNLNNSEPTDKELAEAIIRNDPDAFKQLYYRYFQLLIRFAWYRLHSMETAKDLVQELFSRIWIKRNWINPEKSIKAYLYKSLNNLIINHSKLHSSQTKSLESISEENFPAKENEIESKIDFQNAINLLPEKLKIVYTLNRFEGYKYSEIAEICNLSVKAVEKRMSKAFEILRKIFSDT
jgi:RNA polymerase sigma-70 factor (ECF subfamily)